MRTTERRTTSRSSVKRLGKSLLSLMLAVQAASWLLNDPRMNAYSDDQVDYSSMGSIAEVRAAAERNIALAKQAAMNVVGIKAAPVVEQANVPAAPTGRQVAATSTEDAAEVTTKVAADAVRLIPVEPPAESVDLTTTSSPASDAPILLSLAEQKLDTSSLDEVRGGFDIPEANLQYSFGIERAVYINGELVAHTVLNLKDLQWTAGGSSATVQQMPASGAVNAVSVIQNGPGNTFTTQISPNVAGSVIQNTLNDQKIQNVTTINAAVNSTQFSRSMSVQSAVQSGIVNSLRR